MTKFVIIFVLALLVVEYTEAGRIKRDDPTDPPNMDFQKGLESALAQMQELIKTTFTKENLEKFNQDLQQFGETISTKSKQFVEEANANINKFKAPPQ